MENKYLPIGSICTLKGKNKKVMITGYYSVEFKGNLTIKDYCGCAYPEGMLLPELVCNFNHTDIETIDFVGYKNDEQKTFEDLLNRLTGNVSEEEKAKKFHEDNEMFLTSNKSYSKLLFDENGVVMIAEPAKPKEPENNTKYHFDENGTVISVERPEQENPFHVEYKDSKEVKETPSKDWNIFKNIKFDGNGTVVSAEVNEEPKENTLNKIEFDENGVVIAANGETLKAQDMPKPQYRFNDDGILISDGVEVLEDEKTAAQELENDAVKVDYKFDDEGNDVSSNETISPISSGLPGYVEPKPTVNNNSKYQFDENGIVISAN